MELERSRAPAPVRVALNCDKPRRAGRAKHHLACPTLSRAGTPHLMREISRGGRGGGPEGRKVRVFSKK